MKNALKYTISFMVMWAAVNLLPGTTLLAQVSKTNEIVKTFKADKSTIVDIENKYGDISIETWEKDSVRVDIKYTVSEKNTERLNKKLKELDFELTQSGHYIVINSIITESKKGFLGIIGEEIDKAVDVFRETLGTNESSTEINISVKMPDDLDLRIKNKFGNLYIVDYSGETNFELSFGKLKANELSGYTTMKLTYIDAMVKKIDSGNLGVYFGTFSISEARKLRIDSNTSKINITNVEQLIATSKVDVYRIRMINDFETEANWTDFSISEFSNKSEVKMNFGELTIEKVQPSIDKMVIEAKSTRINLYLADKTDLNFDIVTNKDVSLPDEAKIDTTEMLNDKDKVIRYMGRTGKIDKGEPKIIMNTTSSEISILKN